MLRGGLSASTYSALLFIFFFSIFSPAVFKKKKNYWISIRTRQRRSALYDTIRAPTRISLGAYLLNTKRVFRLCCPCPSRILFYLNRLWRFSSATHRANVREFNCIYRLRTIPPAPVGDFGKIPHCPPTARTSRNYIMPYTIGSPWR